MVRGVPRRSHRRPRGSRAGGWRARPSPGILEIKCPWNKGRPEQAKPYPNVPWYSHAAGAGTMAVFDRPYCDLFCYTVGEGSTIYRVQRDPEYWSSMYAALSDFWWQHVVPGKHALAAGGDWEKYRPEETCASTEEPAVESKAGGCGDAAKVQRAGYPVRRVGRG